MLYSGANRSPGEPPRRIEARVRRLEEELTSTDRDLDETVERRLTWRENEALLMSVPGVGPVLDRMLLSEMLELVTLDRKQLAGVALLNRDSGKLRGRQSVRGGRARGQAALYIGPSLPRDTT